MGFLRRARIKLYEWIRPKQEKQKIEKVIEKIETLDFHGVDKFEKLVKEVEKYYGYDNEDDAIDHAERLMKKGPDEIDDIDIEILRFADTP